MATEPHKLPRLGPRLIAMFRTLSRDPTQAVEERLRRMLHVFLQYHRDNAANDKTQGLAVWCCSEAEIWYYRILESLASSEEERLCGLLENDVVQRCLVASCLEITISLCHLPCDFPLVLQIFRLAPYDFWRVIELVLRTEVSLPYAVIGHLTKVYEKVLENLAWMSDSQVWEEIRANEGHLPSCQEVMPSAQLEDQKTPTDLQPDENCSNSAGNRPQRRSFLYLFSRKIYTLMGKRLRQLCSTLDISDELRLKIWTCFDYSLVHCTRLMADRHLDQLLMCAIYIIAKITKMEIPFKHIMKCYTSQPHANKSVYKNVLISVKDGDENNDGDHSDHILTPNTPSTHYPGSRQEDRGNLIYFYNLVYTTKMQHFAKQFALDFRGDTPPLSPYPRQYKASPRRHRLSNGHTIFISALKPEATPPHTNGLSYFFNSSTAERLREINNMIKTGSSPSLRCRVAPDKEEDKGEDGPSTKRICLDEDSLQTALQRRLRSVVNDRVTRRDQDQE